MAPRWRRELATLTTARSILMCSRRLVGIRRRKTAVRWEADCARSSTTRSAIHLEQRKIASRRSDPPALCSLWWCRTEPFPRPNGTSLPEFGTDPARYQCNFEMMRPRPDEVASRDRSPTDPRHLHDEYHEGQIFYGIAPLPDGSASGRSLRAQECSSKISAAAFPAIRQDAATHFAAIAAGRRRAGASWFRTCRLRHLV